MDVIKYLKKIGIDTIEHTFYSQIEVWESWYKSDAGFHHYYVYNGKNKIRCRRLSLGMAKKLSEDIADLLLNERVKVKVSDEKTDVYVAEVLEANKFLVLGNQYQERKAATGTVAYVVNLKGAAADEEGNLNGGEVTIKYIQAKNIYPISWENGAITECAFVSYRTIGRKIYAIMQIHMLDALPDGRREYKIINYVAECTRGAGRDIPPEDWEMYPELDGLQREIHTGIETPLFVIDKLNIVNNADNDDTNPMGVSIFANSIDTLAKLDLEYDSYANEFDLGRKRIFVAPELLQDVNGNPAYDSNDVVFYQLPEDALKGGQPIVDINMEIRAEQHSKAINDDLNLLSLKTGFGTGHYKFDRGTVTTATEVISENSDMYRAIKKHELVLADVIRDLITAIVKVGKQTGVPGLADEIAVSIDFDDSIIEDKGTERAQDRQDVSMGVMSLAEYRSKWYGETLEEAEGKIPEQTGGVVDTVMF